MAACDRRDMTSYCQQLQKLASTKIVATHLAASARLLFQDIFAVFSSAFGRQAFYIGV